MGHCVVANMIYWWFSESGDELHEMRCCCYLIYIYVCVEHLKRCKTSNWWGRGCWNSWPSWLASPFSLDWHCIVWSRDNNLLFQYCSSTFCGWQLQHEDSRHSPCLQIWWLFFLGRWWGSIVHLIRLNTHSCRWGWFEYGGPWALSRNLARSVDASCDFQLILLLHLTFVPCSLDVSPTSPRQCGTLDGILRLWASLANFAVGTLWLRCSSLKLRHNLLRFSTECDAQSTASDTRSISYQPSSTIIFNPSASTLCQSSSDHQSHAISPIRSWTIYSGSCASDTFWPYDVFKLRSTSSRGEEHCGIQPPSDGRQAIRTPSSIHFTSCSLTNSTSPVPTPTPPLATIPVPTMDQQPPQSFSSFSHRSRSHRHREQSKHPDKRPVSIHRSPRRRSTRRPRRSSRPRTTSRDRSRRRQDSRPRDRAPSIHLRSATPRRHAERHTQEDHYQPHDNSSTAPTLHTSSWWNYQQPTQSHDTRSSSHHQAADSNDKWQSWGKWKDYSRHQPPTHQSTWIDYTTSNLPDTHPRDHSTRPITAY